MSQFNLGAYTQTLEKAEADAVKYKDARVVVWWPRTKAFGHYFLNVHVLSEDPDTTGVLVASVDHLGIITESRWVKEKMGVVAK